MSFSVYRYVRERTAFGDGIWSVRLVVVYMPGPSGLERPDAFMRDEVGFPDLAAGPFALEEEAWLAASSLNLAEAVLGS